METNSFSPYQNKNSTSRKDSPTTLNAVNPVARLAKPAVVAEAEADPVREAVAAEDRVVEDPAVVEGAEIARCSTPFALLVGRTPRSPFVQVPTETYSVQTVSAASATAVVVEAGEIAGRTLVRSQ